MSKDFPGSIEMIIWLYYCLLMCFPDTSVGKETNCNEGDPSSITRSGRSAGERIGYPLQYSWASFVAQLVKNPAAMQETWVLSLGWEMQSKIYNRYTYKKEKAIQAQHKRQSFNHKRRRGKKEWKKRPMETNLKQLRKWQQERTH